nr:hypothetical protein [Xenorhabdus cabanillasii]
MNHSSLHIMQWDAVPVLDAGGLHAFQGFVREMAKGQKHVVVCDIPFQPLKTLARAKIVSPSCTGTTSPWSGPPQPPNHVFYGVVHGRFTGIHCFSSLNYLG